MTRLRPSAACAGVLAATLIASMSWAAQPALPGADGPQLELGDVPPREVELVDVFVYATPDQAAPGVEHPRRFPSGTTRLLLDVRTKALPLFGATFRFEILDRQGSVEIVDALATFAKLSTLGGASALFELQPRAGVYTDGPYQLRLFIDDVRVATLNWSVGEP